MRAKTKRRLLFCLGMLELAIGFISLYLFKFTDIPNNLTIQGRIISGVLMIVGILCMVLNVGQSEQE